MSMPRKSWRSRVARWAVVGMLASLAVSLPAGTASAGTSCTGGCSETHNKSSLGVYAARDWCDGVGACSGSPTMWIPSGGTTPQKQDWDTFRVDAGYCYVGSIRTYVYPFWNTKNYTWDRRGTSAMWVKVANNQTATVDRQSTTSC